MNHIYKTLWSAVHQQYVVTNEKQASHGKPSKSVLTAVVASAVMAMAGNAIASGDYVEPGKFGDAASWETQEYKVIDSKGNSPWSLKAMNASSAYALGFHGQGVHLGVMDSGALITHEDFGSNRIKALEQEQTYGSDGCYYPQNNYPVADTEAGKKAERAFKKGETHKFSGAYDKEYNDSHGTKVTGAIAASRNGVGMHGVSWGANVTVGNTYGNDNTNYGPFLDYEFFKKGWSDLADQGVKVINNSFGTNIKRDLTEVYPILKATKEEKQAFTEEQKKEYNLANFANYYNSGVEITSIKDIEYEYFLFQKRFGGNIEDVSQNKSFVDGAWEAVKDKDTIQVMTAGNNWRNNPYHRALYPYFHPEAEGNWISISAIAPDPEKEGNYVALDENYNGADRAKSAGFNRAGYAKYWTLCSGGQDGYTTTVSDPKLDVETNKEYDRFGGTSMAAPLVTGAFGVLMSRYPDMSAKQVRDILFTTASHTNPDGSLMKGWGVLTIDDLEKGTEHVQQVVDAAKAAGATFTPKIKDGEVDVKMGWGVPDLNKGMFGPGQLLQDVDYELKDGHFDIWSNDISAVALHQRKAEEEAWLKSVSEGDKVLAAKGGDYKLNAKHPIKGIEDSAITKEEAAAWRQAYFDKRAEMIKGKLENEGAGYKAALKKSGAGTLVMTGKNSYEGDTTVAAGTLLAFGESIGNGKLIVKNGGTFGLIEHHNDNYTLKGQLTSNHTADDKLDVTVEGDGKFVVSAFDDVALKTLTLGNQKKILVSTEIGGDASTLAKLYLDGMKAEDGRVKAGSISLSEEGQFEDVTFEKAPEIKLIDRLSEIAEQTKAADGTEVNEKGEAEEPAKAEAPEKATQPKMMMARLAAVPAPVASESEGEGAALFDIAEVEDKSGSKVQLMVKVDKNNTLVADLEKAVDPSSDNEKAVFDALVQSDNAVFGEAVAAANEGDVKTAAPVVQAALEELSDETVAVARNVLVNSHMNVVNTALRGAHDGLFLHTAKTGDVNLWIDGSVTKGHVKGQDGKFKTTFDTVMIGGDYRFSNACKAGAFIGYGHDKAKNDPAQIKMDDLHAGIYAMGDIADVELTAVASYTYADRKINAPVYSSELSDKAKVYNVYGEAALPVSVKEDVRVTPYAGVGYMHVKGEDMSTKIAGLPVTFEGESSNVGYAKLGARAEGVVYHGAADVSLKVDAGFTQFFGDKTAEQKVAFGEGPSATVKSKKLGGLFNIGLGVNAKFSEKVEGELSYRGDFSKAINANGVFGSIKVHF